MLGFLVARAGIDVVVLEKHAHFLRDFAVTQPRFNLYDTMACDPWGCSVSVSAPACGRGLSARLPGGRYHNLCRVRHEWHDRIADERPGAANGNGIRSEQDVVSSSTMPHVSQRKEERGNARFIFGRWFRGPYPRDTGFSLHD